MILIFFVLVGYGHTGSTPKDQNEVQVDKLSKATLAPAIKKAFPLAGMYKIFLCTDNLKL